jgi:hypothetical protein
MCLHWDMVFPWHIVVKVHDVENVHFHSPSMGPHAPRCSSFFTWVEIIQFQSSLENRLWLSWLGGPPHLKFYMVKEIDFDPTLINSNPVWKTDCVFLRWQSFWLKALNIYLYMCTESCSMIHDVETGILLLNPLTAAACRQLPNQGFVWASGLGQQGRNYCAPD